MEPPVGMFASLNGGVAGAVTLPAPTRFARAASSRLKSDTHWICFSKTFHSLIVLSVVEMRNRDVFALWWHQRRVLIFSSISSDFR